jgi:hypothetical protein
MNFEAHRMSGMRQDSGVARDRHIMKEGGKVQPLQEFFSRNLRDVRTFAGKIGVQHGSRIMENSDGVVEDCTRVHLAEVRAGGAVFLLKFEKRRAEGVEGDVVRFDVGPS